MDLPWNLWLLNISEKNPSEKLNWVKKLIWKILKIFSLKQSLDCNDLCNFGAENTYFKWRIWIYDLLPKLCTQNAKWVSGRASAYFLSPLSVGLSALSIAHNYAKQIWGCSLSNGKLWAHKQIAPFISKHLENLGLNLQNDWMHCFTMHFYWIALVPILSPIILHTQISPNYSNFKYTRSFLYFIFISLTHSKRTTKTISNSLSLSLYIFFSFSLLQIETFCTLCACVCKNFARLKSKTKFQNLSVKQPHS